MKTKIIEIDHITKRFKETVAVNELTLDIYDNEIFGLLGPNGAGKTTLIYILATIFRPTSGTARIASYDIIEQPSKVREVIGVSFQEAKLDWSLNYNEILNWHAKVCGISNKKERQERIQFLVEELQMADAKGKPAYKLSGGQKKKIEIAKVLLQRPKVAFIDEPTAFLDPHIKKKIWDFILELREEGATIILATNLMREAEVLCKDDRIGIMNQGRIIKIGSPPELKDAIPGGDIIQVETTNFTPIIEKKLKEIPNILEIKSDDNRILIYLNKAEDVASEILQIFVQNGCRVDKFQMSEPTLDDVFFRYTKKSLKE
ncbi:MAG: ATP-binding cassette domain-containing protein [Candidatus Helarchaeota archaeon]|nr:ATP-binding cassette domain-containing protein [Candidatus Helarchaeota archaeon]